MKMLPVLSELRVPELSIAKLFFEKFDFKVTISEEYKLTLIHPCGTEITLIRDANENISEQLGYIPLAVEDADKFLELLASRGVPKSNWGQAIDDDGETVVFLHPTDVTPREGPNIKVMDIRAMGSELKGDGV